MIAHVQFIRLYYIINFNWLRVSRDIDNSLLCVYIDACSILGSLIDPIEGPVGPISFIFLFLSSTYL